MDLAIDAGRPHTVTNLYILYISIFATGWDDELVSTPAKAPPLSGVVRVPPCTADLSLPTRGKAFFLLYVKGGGTHLFNTQAGQCYIRSGAGSLDLTAHAGT
jgi:hypothetical protein